MDVRAMIQPLLSRAADEASLVAFFVLNFIGVHWLAGAHRWWLKAPAAVCLAASVPFWLSALHFSPATMGPNNATLTVLAGLTVVSGLWLFLTGTGQKESLAGFLLTVFGVAAYLLAVGHRWPAIVCAAMLVPAACSLQSSTRSANKEQGAAPATERITSTFGSSALAIVLTLALISPMATFSAATESAHRLRDFVTQPAMLLLTLVGGTVSLAAFVRLQGSGLER